MPFYKTLYEPRRRLCLALASFVAVSASLVLAVGWLGGVDYFVRLAPGLAGMVPSTAMCFIVLAGVVAWGARRDEDRSPPLAVAGVLVSVVAAVDLYLLATGTTNGIDALVLPHLEQQPRDAMSFATALSFLLAAACACLLATHPDSTARWPVTALATIGLYLPATSVVGHIFDVDALLSVAMFKAMALHTAVLMLLLFLALMLYSRRGWPFIILGQGEGSRGARRLFLPVVLLPLLMCGLVLQASRAGYFDAEFRITVLGVLMMTIGLVAILRNAYIENRNQVRLQQLLVDLEAALADKDLLIREIYHRVKNNLQQIAALIAIEAAKFDTEDDRAPFEAIEGRVQALGLVHQLLMQSPHPSQIDIGRFLTDLGESIARSYYLARRDIKLTVVTEPNDVQLDSAISIGLLVNELIVNAIKHAFPGEQGGAIAVIYGVDPENPEHRRIVVSDNGCGIDVKTASTEPEAGGTRIIRSLVTQLHGTLDMQIRDGTTITISFPATVFDEVRYVR